MEVGLLTLNRFNGQEQFSLSEANVYKTAKDNFVELTFEIATDKKPIKVLPDTQSLQAQPNAEFTVKLKELLWNQLVGKTLSIPMGYNDKTGEFFTRFYYSEHEQTDENLIKIIEKKGDFIHAIITATCVDVNYYDGSKPRAKIEIDGWFQIKG